MNDISNFVKYQKKERLERKNHADEDISDALSPFKNRISIANSYISRLGYKAVNQMSKPLRNQGQKRTL